MSVYRFDLGRPRLCVRWQALTLLGRCLLCSLLGLAGHGAAYSALPAESRWGLSVNDGVSEGVPRRSDVVFSPRFLRPESPAVAQAFGATRSEWVYARDAGANAVLARLPAGVGRTLNANPVLPGGEGYALDFDGTPLIAPWMRAWGARWATTTHPETRRVLDDQVAQALAQGAVSIQFDDPALQYYSATGHAGDFNPATQAGFPAWLRAHPDRAAVQAAGLGGFEGEYRAFLIRRHQVRDAQDYRQRWRSFPSTPLWLAYVRGTVVDYFAALRQRLQAARPRPVALSMNITGLIWPDASHSAYFLTELPDYLMSETVITDTADLVAQAATARALRLGFVPSIRPRDLARNRVAIATLYALGGQPVVPWDVFDGERPRYFGTVEEYGDLYRFVRQHAALFDGREAVASVGIVVDPAHFPAAAVKALTRRLTERQIPYAFVLVGEATRNRALAAARLQGLGLLVTAVPDADLRAPDRAALIASGVTRLGVDAVPTSQLDALRPFVSAPGGDLLRLYARAAPGGASELVIHVVDESRGQPDGAVAAGCSRRVGVRKGLGGVPRPTTATWVTRDSAQPVEAEPAADGLYFTLPGCPLWGVLRLPVGP